MTQIHDIDNLRAKFNDIAEEDRLPGFDVASVSGEMAQVEYLIKGVMNEGDMSITFGDSGSMKSFVELDKAMRLGLGWGWHGHRVKRAGTLIILGEGSGGYPRRVRAFKQHHNLLDRGTDQPWVWVSNRAAELYSNPKKLKSWVHQAEDNLGHPIRHVLFDTFNTNMGEGADENDSTKIGAMLGYAQEAADGRAMTWVHHVGHGDKARERGSYAIRGNMDNRTLIRRDEDGRGRIITVESLKVKDGECFKPFNLSYECEVIGTDSDGDDITSLVMVPTTEEAQSPLTGFKGRGSKRMETLMGLLRTNDGRMSYIELREKYKEANPKDGKNFAAGVRECFVQGLIHDYQPMGQIIAITAG